MPKQGKKTRQDRFPNGKPTVSDYARKKAEPRTRPQQPRPQPIVSRPSVKLPTLTEAVDVTATISFHKPNKGCVFLNHPETGARIFAGENQILQCLEEGQEIQIGMRIKCRIIMQDKNRGMRVVDAYKQVTDSPN